MDEEIGLFLIRYGLPLFLLIYGVYDVITQRKSGRKLKHILLEYAAVVICIILLGGVGAFSILILRQFPIFPDKKPVVAPVESIKSDISNQA